MTFVLMGIDVDSKGLCGQLVRSHFLDGVKEQTSIRLDTIKGYFVVIHPFAVSAVGHRILVEFTY